jgi:hypothetical protein
MPVMGEILRSFFIARPLKIHWPESLGVVMGFLSSLFGGRKKEKTLEEPFEQIRRILEDEEYQLDMLHPSLKAVIKSCPSYDRNPNGTGPFGFSESNPIPVNGPLGELAYLSRLETAQGERILFHRIGAIDRIDVFEAVTFSGDAWFIFYIDYYHPRRSRASPEGFHFTQEVPQFSGFHKLCNNFPYDFVEMKQTEHESGLSMAYIPIMRVVPQIQSGVYQRPLAHKAKLDVVKSRLTSFTAQFGESKHEKALAKIRFELGDNALLPSLPSIQNQEPLKVFKAGEFVIVLRTDVPPWLDEGYGDAMIPVCLMGTNADASLKCYYTVQRIFPNKPPVLVVWQTDGNYRVYSEPYQEPIDPILLSQYFLPFLIKDLGFSENVEVVEYK